MDFSRIIQESRGVSADDFITVVDDAIGILASQKSISRNLSINGKLAVLNPVGEALVIGDLHGDLVSFETILEDSDFLGKMEIDQSATMVFLGDYGDRGANSPELYYVLLWLLAAFPRQIILLRGNHEGPSDLLASPHDLPLHLQRKFGRKGDAVYQRLREFFGHLLNAAYVKERCLMVHGGLPWKLSGLQKLADAEKLHPEKSFLEELLWSDPDESVRGVHASPRGAGYLFGKDITRDVLGRLHAKVLIRGHEFAFDGFKINHDGRILTLFSRKGAPNFNKKGAYLMFPLENKFENTNQLVPFIHQF